MAAVPKLLFLNSSKYCQLPNQYALASAGNGYEFTVLTTSADAQSFISSTQDIHTFVSNEPNYELFNLLRSQNPDTNCVLMTDLPMDKYSRELKNREEQLVDHVIANREGDWPIHDLRICCQKLISSDIFGIDKYLREDTPIHTVSVSDSSKRDEYNNLVTDFASSCRLSSYLSKMIWGISEEMLMNAIYDAPAAAGIKRFQGIPRTTKMTLEPQECATLSFGCDGEVFVMSSSDPFGVLKKDRLLTYLKKVLQRDQSEDIIDSKAEGAGLGLFKILYSCHDISCNVSKGKQTEIIALIELDQQIRDFAKMPRSIHFYSPA